MKMKNKKAEQAADRERHRKQHRKGSSLTRKAAQREEIPSILIVCEGENTEPLYFEQFKISSVKVEVVGIGYNTKSLVQHAIELKKKAKKEKRPYDQVWCVFDKDDFRDSDFNQAVQMAADNKIGAAYSNQSFEYWLLLHFNDHQGGPQHRGDFTTMINDAIRKIPSATKACEYDSKGKKIIGKELFELLNSPEVAGGKRRVERAINRARRIEEEHKHNGHTPAEAESSTAVYRLVEELLKHSR